MSMNGIDVSNWQNGINLLAVPARFCDYESRPRVQDM